MNVGGGAECLKRRSAVRQGCVFLSVGWVHAGLQLCLEGPGSWRSLICLPPGTAKCPLGMQRMGSRARGLQ